MSNNQTPEPRNPCKWCSGKGWADCPKCLGTGYQPERKELHLTERTPEERIDYYFSQLLNGTITFSTLKLFWLADIEQGLRAGGEFSTETMAQAVRQGQVEVLEQLKIRLPKLNNLRDDNVSLTDSIAEIDDEIKEIERLRESK